MTTVRLLRPLAAAVILAAGLAACVSTTQQGATGIKRQQLMLLSSSQVDAMAVESYNGELSKAREKKALNTDINDATIRLLTRMGIEVVVTKSQGCCGALDHHMGHHDPAMRLAWAIVAGALGAGAFAWWLTRDATPPASPASTAMPGASAAAGASAAVTRPLANRAAPPSRPSRMPFPSTLCRN